MDCKVCLSRNTSHCLDIFGQLHEEKNISVIIAKHLWFDLEPTIEQQWICNHCWEALSNFNSFYESISYIHSNKIIDDVPRCASAEKSNTCLRNSDVKQELESWTESIVDDRSLLAENKKDGNQDQSENDINHCVEHKTSSGSSQELSNHQWDDSDEELLINKTRIPDNKDLVPSFSNGSCESEPDFRKTRKIRSARKRDEKLFKFIDEFICYVCPERVEFNRFYHATIHYKDYHKEPAYIKCQKCDKRCYSPGNFISHMASHSDPDIYRCKLCGKQNDHKIALSKHMRIHLIDATNDKLPIRCGICPRRFETEKKRDRHEKTHNRKPIQKLPRIVGRDDELLGFYKRISCEFCDQEHASNEIVEKLEFSNFQDLSKHMRIAHDEKGYLRCHLCGKKCNFRSVLLLHKDFHLHPEKYKCAICGAVYQNLQKHKELVHGSTLQPSFCCEHCGKALTSEKSLKSHVERKHALKDTFCDICNKPFSKTTLESHRRAVHENASYMCSQCPRMFRSKFSLNRHQDDHDNRVRERVKCSMCDMTFKHKYILTKHIDSVHTKEAPVSCDVCGKQFKSKHHLWSHKSDTCNNRRYDCTICGRIFKVKVRLNEHMTTHTGKSLYQCTFCPMTFNFQSILYTHRKKAHYEQWLEMQTKREEGIKFKVMEAPGYS
ncbi:transcription factor grauzone-like [Uranotaenia lowii]|uniref:transcription factor grauzone-like n=1 Tax=Uranotaenia lowii TaxID=190385 RepID=UPI002478DE43|nr:transcription factor grauzone-like [Uranotaenia lowii]